MGEETNTTQKQQQEALQRLYAFVIEQIKAGADKPAISQKLVEMGMNEDDSHKLVDKMYDQIMQAAKAEQLTSASIIPAAIGGLLAAVVCGVIWGMIVIATEYEIGYMAWAVGLAAGFCVVLFSKGKKGLPLQVIAVASSLLGILIGKYLTFFHYLKEMIAEEHGTEAASQLSVLSGGVIQFFLENVVSMSHPLDLLWIVLAVATAWRIPKGTGIRITSNMAAPGT
ncbi:MAG: hypothetical protein ACYS8Z_05850 [Planctomycetota bacterium]|jgi:hypothetical protein